MALSDNEKFKKLKSPRPRSVKAETNKHWSDSQKIEAVTTYLALGNLALTSRVLKIPEVTLKIWKRTQWWKEVEDDLKIQEDIKLSHRLKNIIESTLAVTEDRLKNGDFIYDNKTGGLVRKPVSLKDAHKVTMDMLDRKDILQGRQPNSVNVEQVENKLNKLAEKFAELAKAKPAIEVTDVIIGKEQNKEEST